MAWHDETGDINEIPPELLAEMRAKFDAQLIVMGGDMIDGPLFVPIGLGIKDEEFLELRRQIDMEILHWTRMYEAYWPHRPEPQAPDVHGRLQPKPRVTRYTQA